MLAKEGNPTVKELLKSAKQALAILLPGLFGLVIGAVCTELAARVVPEGSGEQTFMFYLALLLAFLVISMWLHTILHEAGHLIFGLATGYRFCSFRIGRTMLTLRSGRIHASRMKVAGTGGQCLLAPPEPQGGKIPFMLYDLGGVIVNTVVAAVALIVYLLVGLTTVWSLIPLMLAVTGFAFALMNGVPLKTMVNNDGANAVAILREPAALDALRKQLLINEQVTLGVRPKDMPDEWFTVADGADTANPLVSAICIFAQTRLLDEHRFDEAWEAAQQLLDEKSGITGLQRGMLAVDAAYLALMVPGSVARAEQYLDKSARKVMKTMATQPSVIRTEYAMALLAAHNENQAGEWYTRFEKAAKTHPYPCEIALERELMSLVRKKADAALPEGEA